MVAAIFSSARSAIPERALVLRVLRIAAVATGILFMSSTWAAAQSVRATAVRAAAPPTIDGRLNDPAWASAPAAGDFVQHEPREGDPVSERTLVRVLFDDEALYIGAWLLDTDPAGIVKGENRRDASLTETDAFLVVLDTYRDRQNAFVFGTTPAGIEYDGQVTREGTGDFAARQRQQVGSGGGFNLNWDGSWTVATTVDGAGWYAEFRIPFATLRYPRGGPQRWGLNFARNIRRRNEEAFWSRVPRQFPIYRVSEAGELQGLEAPAQRALTLTPYALSSATRDSGASAYDGTVEVGGDAKIGLSSSLILDLTANTDFAQIEVDEQQINLTRFNLFFPEKRPFFLENAGSFAVGTPQQVELFFSRRIGLDAAGRPVPIAGGGRVSGKAAGLILGVLDIQTEADNYAVLRVLRELPRRSRLGVLFANRAATTGSDSSNQTYAVDGRLGVSDALVFDTYAAFTRTKGLNGRDHAFHLSGTYTTRDWESQVGVTEIGAAFNPEVGFLERSGYRFVLVRLLRHVRFPGARWLRELRPHSSYRAYYDFDRFLESAQLHFDNHFAFANGAFFSPAINWTREGLKQPFEITPGVIVQPGTYDHWEAAWRFNTNESAPVSFNGGLDVGGFYSGKRRGVFGTVSARHGATVAAALRVSHSDVELREGSFEATLASLRLAYSFTPRIYLQWLVQYSNQAEQWSGNLRFGWLNTAGTGLFVVYNEAQRTRTPVGPLRRGLIVKFTRQFNLAQ